MKRSKREYLLAQQTYNAFFIAHNAGCTERLASCKMWAEYENGNGIGDAMTRVLMRCKRIIKKYKAQNNITN